MKSLRFLLPVLVTGLYIVPLAAQTPAKPAAKPVAPVVSKAAAPVKITAVEGITEYRLANGLKVLLFPDMSKQTVTVNITYLVGSRNENYGETGMAHLLEHLVFKGTPKHKNVPQELNTHGAQFNGTTWLDRTNYFEVMPASAENLEWALDLEADRMVNSYIAKKDLESEMTVVRNEFEAGENDPVSILFERTMASAFLWHNYGNSTIGARADIEKVPIERLQAFYRTYYQPDNAVLLVGGKFDEAKTLALINQKFGAIPKPKRVIQATYTEEPTQDGEREVTLRRVGDVQALCAIYHIPSGTHADYPACEVLTEYLADDPSGKLYKALVDTRKASDIFGWSFALREPGVAVFGANVRMESSLDEARKAFTATLDETAGAAPSEEDIERIKNKLLKNIELTLNSPENVGIGLSEYIAQGDWRLFFYARDQVRKVTPADVQRVAKLYLKPANRTLGTFIPTKAPDRSDIPAAPDVAALLKDYKGGQAKAQGEAFDPSPANIEKRTQRSKESNISLALLPKKTRGGSVNASMTLRFGTLNALKGKSALGEHVGAMLMRGTTKHTRQQIKDELDKLKARVNIGGGANKASVQIETVRENLPAVLTLVSEILREPAFPADELEKLKQEELAALEQQKSDPQTLAMLEINRLMNPYSKDDPRYVATIDERMADIKALTIDQVKKFYKDFYGASDMTFAASGDLDEKEMRPLVGKLFGDWKSPQPFARIPQEYQEVTAVNKSIETPDKANAMFMAGQNLNINDNDPDFPALFMANEILGGGALSSRLADRIRQKEGISYGVGSYLNASELDRKGYFGVYAIYAPENVNRLDAAFREEIEKAQREGFTADELAKAKQQVLQNNQVERAQDGSLAGTLNQYLFLNRTFKWNEEFEKKIQALTPAQVNAAMKKYIDLNKITVIKAGDFSKKKQKDADAPAGAQKN